jgi:tRNA(fMet)-specific endonuclease VapC
MTGVNVLLDTNIVSAFQKREPAVVEHISTVNPFVSSISIGELFFGAIQSQRAKHYFDQLEALLTVITVLPVTLETGRLYGVIRNRLEGKGRPIPENDIWIAAIAMQYDLILVTRDQHFAKIDGLKRESW